LDKVRGRRVRDGGKKGRDRKKGESRKEKDGKGDTSKDLLK